MSAGLRLALGAVAIGGAVAVAFAPARVRHLAVPTLRDRSLPPAPAIAPAAIAGCATAELARAGGRVSALLVDADGALWIGTFDRGLRVRTPDGAIRDVPGLAGRARFVNALAAHEGRVWAATQGGVVAFRSGAPAGAWLGGEGVTALAVADGALLAGTGRGVVRLSAAGGAEPAGIVGPDGEPLRVTALAVSGATLWIGTPSGAYAVAVDARPGTRARWLPLVFGTPAADTNVVTALAAIRGGAVAGTDDGGLVRLDEDGRVAAVRLEGPRANEINPGAAASGGDFVLAGTQGGGLVAARHSAAGLDVARPAAVEARSVSAVLYGGGGVALVGTEDGAVIRVACPPDA